MSTIVTTFRDRKLQILTTIVEYLKKTGSFEEKIQFICNTIPEVYSDPGEVSVKITIDKRDFFSEHYFESRWLLRELISTPGIDSCIIEIYFSKSIYQGHYLFIIGSRIAIFS